jgi:transposase
MPCSLVHASCLYPCDLTDAEWAHLVPLLPGPARRGRPRRWALRLLVNAIFYVLRTGCAWRYLPREYPPWQTVYATFRRWHLQGVWQRVHHWRQGLETVLLEKAILLEEQLQARANEFATGQRHHVD